MFGIVIASWRSTGSLLTRPAAHQRLRILRAPISRHLFPLFALVVLAGLLVACESPQSTTEIAGRNQGAWGPYRVVLVLAAIVFVVVWGMTVGSNVWFRERPGRTAQQLHGQRGSR